jgi:hypothetical protein
MTDADSMNADAPVDHTSPFGQLDLYGSDIDDDDVDDDIDDDDDDADDDDDDYGTDDDSDEMSGLLF